jgi:hypothetical protein
LKEDDDDDDDEVPFNYPATKFVSATNEHQGHSLPNVLIPYSRGLEKVSVAQLMKKFPADWLTYSQYLATDLYLENR